MKNTYINDLRDSAYPFMPSTPPPWAMSVVSGMSVGIQWKGEYPLLYVGVVSAEISTDLVTLMLAAGTQTLDSEENVIDIQVPLMAISAVPGEAGSAYINTNLCACHAILFAGTVETQDSGSYIINKNDHPLYIDPSCVTLIQPDWLGDKRPVYVNDEPFVPGEVLKLVFRGYLRSEYDVLGNTYYIVSDAPADAATTVQSDVREYSKVLSINNYGIESVANDETGTLNITLGSNISARLDNAIYVSDMRDDDPDPVADPGARTLYSKNLNDENGDGVILTLIGYGDFPSCYVSSEDEAGGDRDL